MIVLAARGDLTAIRTHNPMVQIGAGLFWAISSAERTVTRRRLAIIGSVRHAPRRWLMVALSPSKTSSERPRGPVPTTAVRTAFMHRETSSHSLPPST